MPVVVPAGLGVHWYLDVGVLEAALLESTRVLRDDLRAKGYDVAYQEFPGGLLVGGNAGGRPRRAAPSGRDVKMLPW